MATAKFGLLTIRRHSDTRKHLKRKVDPFRCRLKFVLDYLSMFEKGLAHKTIKVHRSTIYAYHESLHGLPIGQSPLVCSLFSGVFNHRPVVENRFI